MDPSPGEQLRSWHLEIAVFQAARQCSAKCKKPSRSTTTFAGEASVAPGRWCCGAPLLPAGTPGLPLGSGAEKGGLWACTTETPQIVTQELCPWLGKEQWVDRRFLSNSFCSWGHVAPCQFPLRGWRK